MKRVGMQLSGLTSQAKAIGDAVDTIQSSIDKKRKELRAITKKIEAKKKTLARFGKRSEKGMLGVYSLVGPKVRFICI